MCGVCCECDRFEEKKSGRLSTRFGREAIQEEASEEHTTDAPSEKREKINKNMMFNCYFNIMREAERGSTCRPQVIRK